MNHRISPLLLFSALALLPGPGLAQTILGHTRLIGLADGASPTVATIDPGLCAVVSRCAFSSLPPVPTKFAGGTAYDPEHRGLWVSNGPLLARVSIDGCRIQCGPIAAPIGPVLPGTVITALAYRTSQRRLYIVDSSRRLSILEVNGCALHLVERCTLAINLPTQFIVGGLAVDDLTGRVMYTASDFTVGSISADEALFISEDATPCNPRWRLRLKDCSGLGILGPVTGLAFDACSQRLHATNGREIISAALQVSASGLCSLGAISCCLPAGVDSRLVGLSLRSSVPTVSVGQSCTNGSCPTCQAMVHTISSDPTIGNPALTFDLRRAPDDSLAFLVLNEGGCRRPGMPIPPFCAPLLVDIVQTPPMLRGGIQTGNPGLNSCDGFARFSFAVPLIPALCGQKFGSQFLVLCLRGLNLGTGVSNCQSFVIGGN